MSLEGKAFGPHTRSCQNTFSKVLAETTRKKAMLLLKYIRF